jgi:hypothetical protein
MRSGSTAPRYRLDARPRVLQNVLWNIEDGEAVLNPVQVAVAAALLSRPDMTIARTAFAE